MIITISREYGSGGHLIGEKVAAALGLDFYDRNLVEKVAEKSGFDAEFVIRQSEYINAGSVLHRRLDRKHVKLLDPTDIVFRVQKEVILELAEQGNCLFVGRCADAILREAEIESFNVFISADIEARAERVLQLHGDNGIPIEKRLAEIDQKRRNYYNHYTKYHWGFQQTYHMCLNSSFLGIENCGDLIATAAKVKYGK